mgnify:CR=1 FL=1
MDFIKMKKSDSQRILNYLIKARDIVSKYEDKNGTLLMNKEIANDALNYLSVIESIINDSIE